MVRQPDERAAICVVTALEGQSIPWVLQHKLIENVAEEIRSAIAAERRAMADALEIQEASEESLRQLRDFARQMKTQDSGRDVGEPESLKAAQ